MDTHLLCHKDSSPVEARQITETEWKSMKDEAVSDDDVEMTQRLIIRGELPPSTRQIAKKTVLKRSINSLPSTISKRFGSSSSPITAAESQSPLPVNKTKAQSMEDFFAQILTERVHHK